MTIWTVPDWTTYANEKAHGTLNAALGIEQTELGPDYVKARMPVDHRTFQPAGVLHGGASVVLAETLASWAGSFAVDRNRFHCVGQEINANHVRPVSAGFMEAVAMPEALGRRSHVWSVRFYDAQRKLACVSRVTPAVLERPSEYQARRPAQGTGRRGIAGCAQCKRVPAASSRSRPCASVIPSARPQPWMSSTCRR